MVDDILLNKSQIIRRCILRIHEEYANTPTNLQDITRQDAIVINIQRACEAAIDLAMHVVAERNLGIPQISRDAFSLLETAGILTAETARQMRAMVGFRNLAVHNYQAIGIDILRNIIEHHLSDFERFITECTMSR